VQRVGEQEQAVSQFGGFGAEHGGLASAVGVAAEVDSPGSELSQPCYGIAEALAVASGVAGAGRAEAAKLAERQVAAQDGEAGGGEGVRERAQQWRLAVGARAVGQYEAVGQPDGTVEEASNRWVEAEVCEIFGFRQAQLTTPR